MTMKKAIESAGLCRCPGEDSDLCRDCARTSPTKSDFNMFYSYVQFRVQKTDPKQLDLFVERQYKGDQCSGFVQATWIEDDTK